MEATNIKEFYESFNNLDSPVPEEIDVDINPIEPHSFKTTNHSTSFAPANTQQGILTNLENISHLGDKQYYNSRLPGNNNSFNVTNNIENTNFLPVEKTQIFFNQCGASNGILTYNKTSRKFNDRLERIFTGFENTNVLPNCQAITTSQTYGIPNDQHFISEPFTNHNDKLGSISHNLNTPKSFSPSLHQTLHSGHIFTHQNEGPRRQHVNYNTTINYDQMENILGNFRNINSLPRSTSCQTAVNQHNPLGNISINIGNTVSSSCCPNFPKNHIFANHREAVNMENNSMLPNNQYFMSNQEIRSQNNLVSNDPHKIKTTKYLPKIILRQCVFNPNLMTKGHFVIANQDIKENAEKCNQHGQVFDISRTMDNIPFQQFSSTNGKLRKSSTNPSININNIKRINVHVHHPSNFTSMSRPVVQPSDLSLLADQRVPLMPSHYASETSPYNLYPHEVSPSQTVQYDCRSDGSRSVSTNQNSTETEYTYTYDESIKGATRDDIYLPTSKGNSVSADIDEWLNTIQLSPLESNSGQYYTTNISSESEQVNPSNRPAIRKKKSRARAKIDQHALNILKMWFQTDPYPNHGELETIAEQVGHTVTTVRVWFQNRRQTLKKQGVGVRPNKNTAPSHLSTGDQDEQHLTNQQLEYSVMEYPTPSNAWQVNDGSINYPIQVANPSTAYHEMNFIS